MFLLPYLLKTGKGGTTTLSNTLISNIELNFQFLWSDFIVNKYKQYLSLYMLLILFVCIFSSTKISMKKITRVFFNHQDKSIGARVVAQDLRYMTCAHQPRTDHGSIS